MRRWLILADDLTGAADCAIGFARRGLEASVGWHGKPAPASAVLAIDADSRRLPPAAAGARHAALLRTHHASGPEGARQGLIKKIDSTLRGQPLAELVATLAALRDTGGPRLALVAPAFPATARTTRDGRVWLDDAPLEASPLWARDHSYSSADLPAELAAAGLSARLLPLATLRNGGAAGSLAGALACGADALVCDAEAADDLRLLAEATLPLADRLLWVGSGGIALALAGALEPGRFVPPPPPRRPGGVLVVVGSVAEASRAAAARLVAERGTQRFAIPPALLRAGAGDPGWAPLRAGIGAALAAGWDTLAEIAPDPAADLAQGALLAERLAELLAPAAAGMAGLFATGGETACALLSRLGVHGIRLLEEVEPGVPLGVTQGALTVPVMTKAGGFGQDGTILRSLDRLHALLGTPT